MFDNEIVVNVIVGVCVPVNNFGIIRNPSLFCKISSFLNWVAVKIKFERSTKTSRLKKTVNRVCGKKMTKYIYIGLKKDLFGLF